MSNYHDTKDEFESIEDSIEEIKKVSEENIEVIKQLQLSDLDVLKKQTEYNILYIIYLEKNIEELEKRKNNCIKSMSESNSQKRKYKKILDRVEDDYAGIIIITSIITLVMSLLYTANFLYSVVLSFLMTNLAKISMNLITNIVDEKDRKTEDSIYQKEIDILENGIELLKSIKKIYEEENEVRYQKIEELTLEKNRRENANNRIDVRAWAQDIHDKNYQHSKKRVLRKTNKNRKYFG